MMTPVTMNELGALLLSSDNFLILTHRRPDGDTIGCAVALCEGLRNLGKTAFLFNNTETTARYLSFAEAYFAADDFVHDTLITVDTATENLFPENSESLMGKVDICIDHHGSNDYYAKHTYLDSSRGACGEIIYELLLELGCELNQPMADAVYLAVSTDTGCFRYVNTSGNTLRVAAAAHDAGARAYEINKIMFGTKTLTRYKIESMLIQDLKLYDEGRTSVMILTREMMQDTGATEDDVDDISGLPRGIMGVETGILLRELGSNLVKVSLRTAGLVNASAVCELLGGGGHPGAAGAVLQMGIDEALDKVLQALWTVQSGR